MNFVSITISYWRFFFQCEICHLAKHIHSTHHSQKYKVSSHFSLVHSDIWGLSQVKHLMEKKMVYHMYLWSHLGLLGKTFEKKKK